MVGRHSARLPWKPSQCCRPTPTSRKSGWHSGTTTLLGRSPSRLIWRSRTCEHILSRSQPGHTPPPRTRNAWSDRLACLPSGGSRPSSTSGPLWISISTSLSPTTTTPTRSGSHCGSLRSSATARRGPRIAAPGPGGRCASAMRSWTSHTIAPARTLRLGTHRSGSRTSGASTSSQMMPECGCDCTSGQRARPECSVTKRSWTTTCASSGTS
mmetsp:Transcript_44892/g.143135  ORF Transcript_44892/g.143135 Transcript_44892/m.143135 type:complete len:212 (-) Transcript_44892:79-714(-)